MTVKKKLPAVELIPSVVYCREICTALLAGFACSS
jgi:hypothetical protein